MELSIDELMPISISEFEGTSKIPLDLYVKLDDNKFLLVVRAGTEASVMALSDFARQHLEEVWVKKIEFRKNVSKNILNASTVLSNRSDLAPSGQASVLSHATNAVFNEIEKLGFSRETYIHAKNITGSIVKMVDQKPELSQIIAGLELSSDRLVDHSVAVSAISVMIGRVLNWQKDTTIEKLGLGGILHDIGKKELSKELLNKPRIDWSHDEMTEYETHPHRGMQILQTLDAIPDDVISIVYEHHENAFGQGFPRKLREVRMNPLAKVVSLANAFVNLTLSNINSPRTKSAKEAIHHLENIQGRPYNREAFLALKALVERDQTAHHKKIKKGAA
ncbi:MAG: HD domain-containing protein [Pseudomonadota bacterium]|nr:HD domain-containing protein [Pseudomonadota bacterium]